MELLSEHFGELMVGLVLAVFGWGFTSWSTTLSKSTAEIMQSFKKYIEDYNRHKLDYERRLTRMEVQLSDIERRLNAINGDRRRNHDENYS